MRQYPVRLAQRQVCWASGSRAAGGRACPGARYRALSLERSPGTAVWRVAPCRSMSRGLIRHPIPVSAAIESTRSGPGCAPATVNASTDGPAPDTMAATPAARSRPSRSAVPRHDLGPVSLVQVVLGRVEQHRRIPGQRRDQQRAAGRVRGRVPVRHRRGQRAARGRRGQALFRNEKHRADLRPAPAAGSSGDRRGPGLGAVTGSGPDPAVQAMVSPPCRQAATLSGCPSRAAASCSTAGSGSRSAPPPDQRPGGQDAGR